MMRIARPRVPPFAVDLGPAALVVLAWTLIWALVLVDVVAPLGRWRAQTAERPVAAWYVPGARLG
jgi:hypothetical protein